MNYTNSTGTPFPRHRALAADEAEDRLSQSVEEDAGYLVDDDCVSQAEGIAISQQLFSPGHVLHLGRDC